MLFDIYPASLNWLIIAEGLCADYSRVALLFAIGFYETRLAYYAWRGAEGYRFAAIPDY